MSRNTSASRVFVNVYDLDGNNDTLYPIGLGFYHSGLQINSEEYTFGGGSGIFCHEPKNAPGANFRESIYIGDFKGTSRDLETILNKLKSRFGPNDYNILNNNCNSFSNELCLMVTGKPIPSFINRMAWYGNFFSCLLPESLKNQTAPVTNGTSTTNNRLTSSSSSYSYTRVSNNNTEVFKNAKGIQLSTNPIHAGETLQERKERVRAANLARFGSQ